MEIPTATLIDCGLPADKANQLVNLLRQIPVQSDEELWRFLTAEVLTPEIPFGVHQLLYQRVFAERISNGEPAPAWFPGERELQQSHLAEWRIDLNLADYDAVHDWSISNRNDFTSKLIDSLEIQFREPPQQIMCRGG